MTRSRKGTVSIENLKDTIRLRWTFKGERYCLSLGFPNTALGQTRAKELASRIELDMIAGYFDETLQKYGKLKAEKFRPTTDQKSKSSAKLIRTEIKLIDSYDKWIQGLEVKTNYHRWTRSYLFKSGSDWDTLCKTFATDLESSRFSWKHKKSLVLKFLCSLPEEFYGELKKEFQLLSYPGSDKGKKKHPTRQPFTNQEIIKILDYADEFYPQYSLMIELWILTGLRNGEIFGLRPKDFKDDFTKIVISESLTKNQNGKGRIRKSTKTDNIRTLKISGDICDRLKTHCQNLKSDQLLFRSPTGYPIHDGNFRRRVWTKILSALGMTYRVPYACRHTMASRALESGLNPVAVASLLGHSSPTLVLERYGHVITQDEQPELPNRKSKTR